MKAVCVDPKQIRKFWPHFKERIDRAINRVGLIDPAIIEKDVLSGRSLLWLAYDGLIVHAAAVTELHGGVCEIVACGGENLQQFLPLINDLEQYARREGCKAMRVIGRKGWLRILKDYQTKAFILERPL
jgi:hypothetical protein